MAKTIEERIEEDPKKFVTKIVVWLVVAIVLLMLIFGAFYTIDAGERGIILTFGAPSNGIMQPGIHMKIPFIQKLVVYSIRTTTIAFDNPVNTNPTPNEYDSLSAASKDLQTVQVGTVVNYHINEKDVLDIYKQYGDSKTYQTNILEPIIRNTVKATSAHWDASDLVDKRSEVVAEATDILSKKFAEKNAVLDNINLVNFEYSKEFADQIEKKVTAQQQALTEKNRLESVQYIAQQRIEQARGEAEAIRIQSASIASAGGSAYLTLKWIEKWNGVVSIVNGNSNPIIDMRGTTSSNIATASAIVTNSS